MGVLRPRSSKMTEIQKERWRGRKFPSTAIVLDEKLNKTSFREE